jgi:hypothetical protein
MVCDNPRKNSGLGNNGLQSIVVKTQQNLQLEDLEESKDIISEVMNGAAYTGAVIVSTIYYLTWPIHVPVRYLGKGIKLLGKDAVNSIRQISGYD